jgi:hypothetical protein
MRRGSDLPHDALEVLVLLFTPEYAGKRSLGREPPSRVSDRPRLARALGLAILVAVDRLAEGSLVG